MQCCINWPQLFTEGWFPSSLTNTYWKSVAILAAGGQHLKFVLPSFLLLQTVRLESCKVVHGRKLHKSGGYEGKAHCNKPVHCGGVGHFGEWLTGTDAQCGHGQDCGDSWRKTCIYEACKEVFYNIKSEYYSESESPTLMSIYGEYLQPCVQEQTPYWSRKRPATAPRPWWEGCMSVWGNSPASSAGGNGPPAQSSDLQDKQRMWREWPSGTERASTEGMPLRALEQLLGDVYIYRRRLGRSSSQTVR